MHVPITFFDLDILIETKLGREVADDRARGTTRKELSATKSELGELRAKYPEASMFFGCIFDVVGTETRVYDTVYAEELTEKLRSYSKEAFRMLHNLNSSVFQRNIIFRLQTQNVNFSDFWRNFERTSAKNRHLS